MSKKIQRILISEGVDNPDIVLRTSTKIANFLRNHDEKRDAEIIKVRDTDWENFIKHLLEQVDNDDNPYDEGYGNALYDLMIQIRKGKALAKSKEKK